MNCSPSGSGEGTVEGKGLCVDECKDEKIRCESTTYRQKYVAVAVIKVSMGFLWNLNQLHFL